MAIYPKITLALFNGFWLILALIAIRFGIPALIDKKAMPKLDYFPPTEGFESLMKPVYPISNLFLIFSPLLARIRSGSVLATVGWVVYLLGAVGLAVSLFNFSASHGMVKKGLYRYSRNPIYIGYFLIYIGVGLLIGSWCYLFVALVYQYAVHWMILSEERWCREQFGESFTQYERQAPRYL